MENATASESGTKSCRPTPIMKNDGTKTARIAEHGEQARHGGAAARLHHGPRARDAGKHLGVNVLDLDGGLVNQNSRPPAPARRAS